MGESGDLWLDCEEKCEGKTIETLSADSVAGIIIRFTDGSKFSLIDGVMRFDEKHN